MPLIVLEGLDGAGKSTQMKLIRQMLSERGAECEYIHFPRFETPVYGELIARFLRGELGSIDSVDPYIVALLFAGDRADAAKTISLWLAEGKYVLLDRYVGSNIAYQCAKIIDREKQDELMRWILDLEYTHNGIPRPDLSVFMDVPSGFTRHNLTKQRAGDDRSYLKGCDDIHEASLDFQQRVRDMYLRLAEQDDTLRVVSCAEESGEMGAAKDVFEKIKRELDRIGN